MSAEPIRGRNGKPVRDLWRFVDVTGFCWLWTGFCSPDGYGYYSNDQGSDIVHRQAYEALVGAIGEGLELDHLCRIRNCLNPDHLEPVSRAENNRRSSRYRTYPKRKSQQCQRGHAWTASNTIAARDGSRRCRACRLITLKLWKAQRASKPLHREASA